MGRFARSSRHLERHAQNARLSRNLGVKDASCHEELDSVGTARGQIAYVVARLLRRCGHLGKKACTMTIGHSDSRTRCHDARAKITSGVDSITHSNIGIQRVTRTAHTRHTACKLLLSRAFENMAYNHAARGIIQAAHEVAGVSRRHRLSRTAKMDMHIDEAWQQIRIMQVDHLGLGRQLGCRRRLNAYDATLVDKHGHTTLRLHVTRAIENRRINECKHAPLHRCHGNSPASFGYMCCLTFEYTGISRAAAP